MKPVHPLLGMDTAWRRGAAEPRASAQFAADIARLRARAVELNLDAGAVHMAAEIAALEPSIEGDDDARFALIVLIAISSAALAEGSTRFPVGGAESSAPLERMLTALMAPEFDESARARVRAKITAILADGDGAAAIIGRTPDARKPLLYLHPYLYPQKIHRAEQRLGRRLADLLQVADAPDRRAISKAIADVAARPAMTGSVAAVLSEEQRRAVELAAGSRLAVISGGPGTGKTSIIAAIVRVLARIGIDPATVALAAPTGKAAYRMSESIRNTIGAIQNPAVQDRALGNAIPAATTIHRLLGYSNARRSFLHHGGNPLEAAVVIVDEASMLDLTLIDRLSAALRPAALLPAQGLGRSDAMDPVRVTLRENYRARSDDSGGAAIAQAARLINDGRADLMVAPHSPMVRRADSGALQFSGVEFVAGGGETLGEFLSCFARAQIDSDGFAAMAARTYALEGGAFRTEDSAAIARMLAHLSRARILCLTRVGRFGADAINARMHREALGHSGAAEQATMIAGEPVMVLRNDYDHLLFNGDQGVLVNLAERGGRHSLAAVFAKDAGLAAYRVEMLADAIDLCYATTVHKAQGSEFDCVGLILPERDLPLLARETIYTAVSRSRRSCVIFGGEDLLAKAIARRIERFSGLADAIGRDRAVETKS